MAGQPRGPLLKTAAVPSAGAVEARDPSRRFGKTSVQRSVQLSRLIKAHQLLDHFLGLNEQRRRYGETLVYSLIYISLASEWLWVDQQAETWSAVVPADRPVSHPCAPAH